MGNKSSNEKIYYILQALQIPGYEHFFKADYQMIQSNYVESTQNIFKGKSSHEIEKKLDLSFIKDLFYKEGMVSYQEFESLTNEKFNPKIFHDNDRKAILLHLSNIQFLLQTFPKFFNYYEMKVNINPNTNIQNCNKTETRRKSISLPMMILIKLTSLDGKLCTMNRLIILSILNSLGKEKIIEEKIILMIIMTIDLLLKMPLIILSEDETIIQQENGVVYWKKYKEIFIEYDIPSKSLGYNKDTAMMLATTLLRHIIIEDNPFAHEIKLNVIVKSQKNSTVSDTIYKQFIKEKIKVIKREIFDGIHEVFHYQIFYDPENDEVLTYKSAKKLFNQIGFFKRNNFIFSSSYPTPLNDITVLSAFLDNLIQTSLKDFSTVDTITLELNLFKFEINQPEKAFYFKYFEDEIIQNYFFNSEYYEQVLLLIEKISKNILKPYKCFFIEKNCSSEKTELNLNNISYANTTPASKWNLNDKECYLLGKMKWMMHYLSFVNTGHVKKEDHSDFFVKFDLKKIKICLKSLIKLIELLEYPKLSFFLNKYGDHIMKNFDELYYDIQQTCDIPFLHQFSNRKLSIVENQEIEKAIFTVYVTEQTEDLKNFLSFLRSSSSIPVEIILCLPQNAFSIKHCDCSLYDLIVFKDTHDTCNMVIQKDYSICLDTGNENNEKELDCLDDLSISTILSDVMSCHQQVLSHHQAFQAIMNKGDHTFQKLSFYSNSRLVYTFSQNSFSLELDSKRKIDSTVIYNDIYSKFQITRVTHKLIEILYSKELFEKWQDIFILFNEITKIQITHNLQKVEENVNLIMNALFKYNEFVKFQSLHMFNIFSQLSPMLFMDTPVLIKSIQIAPFSERTKDYSFLNPEFFQVMTNNWKHFRYSYFKFKNICMNFKILALYRSSKMRKLIVQKIITAISEYVG